MKELTLSLFKTEAAIFVRDLSATPIVDLYSITDGKAVGTYVEQAFNNYLGKKYLSKKLGLKPRLLKRNVFGVGQKSPLQKQLLTSDF